jgi:hypothetical protein
MCALAGYRLAVLASTDDLTEPIRRRLWAKAWPGMPFDTEEPEAYAPARRPVWAWLYEGVSCGYCTSVWATAGALWAWYGWGEVGRGLVVVAAAMGAAAFLVGRDG